MNERCVWWNGEELLHPVVPWGINDADSEHDNDEPPRDEPWPTRKKVHKGTKRAGWVEQRWWL